ncbi:hypothetical protein HRbin30_01553 [bacterium HR30]|nr:hypothetical protein HRbin30_01553 [bacterium HR30]
MRPRFGRSIWRVLAWGILLALPAFFVLAVAWVMWPDRPLEPGVKADKIVVLKSQRRLLLLRGDKTLKAYRVAIGRDPRGHKLREGDGRTPEGTYYIDWRNPKSKFHLSLHISYPNEADRARARAAGVSPGGNIMIHGLGRRVAWLGRLHWLVGRTHGCIAVTNREIEEIWRAVDDGTPVEIRP